MNTIATEALDKLAADPTAFGSIGPRSFAKLVELARLQAALNECEAALPDDWELKLSVGAFGRIDMFTAVAGYCYSLRHYRRNVGKARSCPFEMTHGATALAALLALRDALAARR